MKLRTIITASALAIGLGLSAPALAQDSEAGTGSQDATADDNQIDDGDSNIQNEDSLYADLDNILNGSFNDNAPDDNSSSDDDQTNGNSLNLIVAAQTLTAVNVNQQLDEVADFDGVDEDESSVGYNSGNNSVNDMAFAAFAGILNNAWNTGLNANTQAATNIAAQGTVNFGTGDGGAGSGDGD